jgi:enamine deaminase RidA (YjgF/YER057c/UK114 family)
VKKQVIFPESMPRPRVAYSPLVKAGPFVYVSGQLASDFSTGIPTAVKINTEFPHHGSNIERQTDFVLKYLRTTLEAGGSSLENCLLLGIYQTDPDELYDMARTMQDVFGATGVPPNAAIVVEELPIPGCKL